LRCSELAESDTGREVAFDDPTTGGTVTGKLWQVNPTAGGATVVLYISRPSDKAGVDIDITEHHVSGSHEIDMSDADTAPR
jgi:hypothetical protein